MFTPPGFVNIKWNVFIVFGILCMLAAAWFFVFYPETYGKTLEEVEIMFGRDGPAPWKTRKGESRLDAEIQAVIGKQQGGTGGEEGPRSCHLVRGRDGLPIGVGISVMGWILITANQL
jgi:hypothetical protein